jgi:Reverse transcriptase (RNA-dependent DNA polymerase)/Recombinase zinc beta ribbon domain
LYLLQGLLQCQHCGYAFYGKRLSPSARQGKPRAYAYYRCLGTDAHRFGGERLCQNTQVRTDLLDLAVWQEVCTLLAHPERLAEEYRRRLQPETRAQRTPLATVEAQISKLRQGVARLIDSYADGFIDKSEFEPRITRLRQRLARLEAQRQALADEAALHGALQLIIGRLEDFAAKLHDGLEAADWASKRDLIRALVKRVEVARHEVNVVFRIDPYPSDNDPEKKVCNFVGGESSPVLANVFLHHVLDEWFEREVRPRMQGRCFLLRFADDFVIGCEAEADARRIMAVLPKRFARFGLHIHPAKTALIAFQKPETRQGSADGNGTFDFLGLTHYWTRSRQGFWVLKRRTARKRLRRTKKSLWRWCRTNRHAPLQYQYHMLCQKLRGHFQYYGIRGNFSLLEEVRRHAEKAWQYWLSRRSSQSAIGWEKFQQLLQTYALPIPKIVHNI